MVKWSMATADPELIGVYDADGGPVGEASYVVGKFLGRRHCSLCDITHSPFRRKPEWDRMLATTGLSVGLVHRNEVPAELQEIVAEVGTPVVLRRTSESDVTVLLSPVELDSLGGSVSAFEDAVTQRLAELPPGARPPTRS